MHFHARTRVIEDRESDKVSPILYIFETFVAIFPEKIFVACHLISRFLPISNTLSIYYFIKLNIWKTYFPIQYWSSSLSFISLFFFWSHSIIICVCNEKRKKCMQVDIKCFVEFCDTNNRTSINSNKIIFFQIYYFLLFFFYRLPILLTIRGIRSKVYTAWIARKTSKGSTSVNEG